MSNFTQSVGSLAALPAPAAEAGLVSTEFSGLPRFTQFANDKSGSTAIMFGLMLAPLMMIIGMSVDYSRALSVRNQTQAALDASALAAARAAQMNPTTATASALSAATNYFNSAKPGAIVSTNLVVDPPANSGTTFKVTATNWIRTPFIGIGQRFINKAVEPGAPAGCDTNGSACVKLVNTATAVLQQGSQDSLEVAMMLDITGSMKDFDANSVRKITSMKLAASDAVDILVWNDQSVRTSKVSIVPFAQDVRLPTAAAFTAAAGSLPAEISANYYDRWGNSQTGNFRPTNQNCVVERTGPQKYTDAAPGVGAYSMVERVLHAQGVSTNCNVPAAAAIQPLTNDKTALHAKIDGLDWSGGTAGQIGTAWAWYTLSPNFNALWDVANRPQPYGTVKLKKVMILMTDGDYNTEYDANGINTDTTHASPANGDGSQNQAGSLCTAIKNKDIVVYTIGFLVSANAETFLKDCSTHTGTTYDHYYPASDSDSIRAAFRDIALKLSNARLIN